MQFEGNFDNICILIYYKFEFYLLYYTYFNSPWYRTRKWKQSVIFWIFCFINKTTDSSSYPHDMGLSDRTENRGFNSYVENKNNTYSHIILELENL